MMEESAWTSRSHGQACSPDTSVLKIPDKTPIVLCYDLKATTQGCLRCCQVNHLCPVRLCPVCIRGKAAKSSL